MEKMFTSLNKLYEERNNAFDQKFITNTMEEENKNNSTSSQGGLDVPMTTQ